MALIDILDPLDLGGRGAAESTLSTARTNADLLRGFSDQSQANLQPFLDLSNAQLGPLEAGATPEGFFDVATQLRPLASAISQPIAQKGLRDLSSQLGSAGLTRSGFAGTAAADVQEDADLGVLLQLQSMLTGRRQQVAGLGQGTGQNLARIGQQSAEQLGQIGSQGILGSQQALAAGQQNLIGLAGLGAQFIPAGGGSVHTGGAPNTFVGPQQITFPN